MESSRVRTVLPVVGILLVVIIALVAFFITRRVSNSSNQTANATSNGANNLILPSTANTAGATPRATVASMNTMPNTGIVENPVSAYQEPVYGNGFKDSQVSVAQGVAVTWKNEATTPLSLTIDGLSSGPIAPGKTFSYLFDQPKQFTIVAQPSSTSELISVQ